MSHRRVEILLDDHVVILLSVQIVEQADVSLGIKPADVVANLPGRWFDVLFEFGHLARM